MACEACGAVYWGNIGCLTCLRWNKRQFSAMGYPTEFYRVLITITKRKLRGYR